MFYLVLFHVESTAAELTLGLRPEFDFRRPLSAYRGFRCCLLGMIPSHRSFQVLLLTFSRFSLTAPRVPDRRLFTQNAQLFLLSSHDPRPQLPFLHSPQFRHRPNNRFQVQLSRLLTTETRTLIKDSAKTLGWTTVVFWTVVGLFTIAKLGLDNEILERKYPSPQDWSFISKWQYRNAKGLENPDKNNSKLVDWAQVGSMYKPLIARLEDPEIDGADIHPQLGDGEEIYVEGIGKTGLDITQKSEPWRRAYHDTLMGAARVAEHLETWVLDKTRGYVFPSEVVIGPSNPRPRPVPFGAQSAPREEDCEPASEMPHVYYMKVLTTNGFTSRQRLDAALAYADWLRYKGLNESAEDMYTWALDIAVAGISSEIGPVDKKTGIINSQVHNISTNLLLATTSLAAHYALVGNLAAALPIFLSVLRAQQNLPYPSIIGSQSSHPDFSNSHDSIIELIKSLVQVPAYPPPPLSGDEPASRTPAMVCAEAGTMVRIGEILYASSPSSLACIDPTPSQAAGLSWTRDGVDLAEATLRSIAITPVKRPSPYTAPGQESRPSIKSSTNAEAKTRCAECLTAGISNWTTMTERHQQAEKLARIGEREKLEAQGVQHDKKGRFWSRDTKQNLSATLGHPEGMWELEAKRVKERGLEIKKLLREEGAEI